MGPPPPNGRVTQVRDRLVFPGSFPGCPASDSAGLRFDAPRPDATDAAFCQSCHNDDNGPSLTLTTEALEHYPNVTMQMDRRRQPMQAPRVLYGNQHPDFMNGQPSDDAGVIGNVPSGQGAYSWDRWAAPGGSSENW